MRVLAGARGLQTELEQTKTALEERKVIDRAKGILMKAKNFSEEAAYALLRKTAMNENRKIVDVAQSVITAFSPGVCS